MTQFKFKTSEILQGDFKVANDLNLLLAFQVNCPGCFIYALPLAETLHNQYGNRLNVLGLSTAFEDFELNTVEHTKKLLDGGEVIGQTQKYLSQMGEVSYSSSISFPIAFDQVGKASEIFTPEDVDYLCGFVPSFSKLPEAKQNLIRKEMESALCRQSLAGYTFQLNQLQGTPSWILFDGKHNILSQWFGHKSRIEVNGILKRFLEPVTIS